MKKQFSAYGNVVSVMDKLRREFDYLWIKDNEISTIINQIIRYGNTINDQKNCAENIKKFVSKILACGC